MQLPNNINLEKLSALLKYSDRYEINIQFWPTQTAVYINKGGIELQSYGGDFDFAIDKSVEYLDRLNSKTSFAIRTGSRFIVKSDPKKEVYTFDSFESFGDECEIHCYDSNEIYTIIKDTFLSDLQRV